MKKNEQHDRFFELLNKYLYFFKLNIFANQCNFFKKA